MHRPVFYSKTLEQSLVSFKQYLGSPHDINHIAEESLKTLLIFHDELEDWKGKNSPNVCKSQCSHCCNHWVDGLDSFEALAIYSQLRKREDFTDLLTAFFERETIFEQHSIQSNEYDQALHLFYRNNRSCPTLTSQKECAIYAFRPIICSLYQAEKNPDLCKATSIESHPENNQIIEVDLKHQKTLAQIDSLLSDLNIPESYFKAMLHLFERESDWQKGLSTFL